MVGPRRNRSSRRALPRLERLEGRDLPSTVTVGSLADSGPGSLRAALLDPSVDTIRIDPSLAGGTLTLTSGELQIGHAVAVVNQEATPLTVSGNNASRVFHVLGGATASLSGLTVMGGRSSGSGGGILVDSSAVLALQDCTVAGNSFSAVGGSPSYTVSASGGGVFSAGILTLTDCTVRGNQVMALVAPPSHFNCSATAVGGGIAATGTVTLTNVTIAGNTSVSIAAAVFATGTATSVGGLFSTGPTALTDCTITSNASQEISTSTQALGSVRLASTGRLRNTIVAGNTFSSQAPTGGVRTTGAADIATPVDSTSSYNLIGTGGSGGLVNGVNHNQVGVANPGLGALGDYGGPTQTISLLAGSPAIGAGDPALAGTTDQRGGIRGLPVSIGAFQPNVVFPTSTALTSSPGTSVYGQSVTFAAAVTSGGSAAPSGTVTFKDGGTTLATVTLDGTGHASYSTTSLTAAGSPHAIAAAYNPTASYQASTAGITQTVTPAALTVRADDQTRPRGQANPTLTASYSGFVNGDTPASLGGTLILATAATPTSPAGTYPIAAGGLTSTNYTITYVNGTLTVTPAALTFVVTTTADDGAGTLRQALRDAQDGDTVAFDASLSGSTIALTSGELLVSHSIAIANPATGRVTVSGNNASRVFEVAAGTSVRIAGLTIANGWVASGSLAEGGGILSGGNLTLTDCTVTNNHATVTVSGTGVEDVYAWGGGISTSGPLTLLHCTVAGNSALLSAGNLDVGFANGGGLYSNGGNVTLTNCTVAGNAATATYTGGAGLVYGFGGGLTSDLGTLTMTGCTVAFNTVTGGNADGDGAGVHSYQGSVTLGNCTIAFNTANSTSAGAVGGGVSDLDSSLSLTNCTITGNVANSPAGTGGIAHAGVGTAQLLSTIVAGNSAGTSAGDVSGAFASLGTNLIGVTDGSSGWVASDLTGTAAAPLDAGLGTLGNYGGPTQTIPLLAGSPALNAGDPSLLGTADQRGVARAGGVNIGAFQASASAFTVCAPASVLSGMPFGVTVTAVDQFGQVAVGYAGTVYLISTDPQATYLDAWTFTPADGGSHTFAGEVLLTAGPQTLSAVDDSGLSGGTDLTVG